WSVAAMVELVVPLAITVLVVQNGQGFAVLRAAGHGPPVNAVTVACGIGSVLAAVVGAVSTCLTGPTNAILVSSGERERQYTAGIVVAVLAILFGLFAPTFANNFSLGALVAFLVTVADVPLLNVGAAFWGLIAGLIVSGLLERADFKEAKP